MHGSVSPEGRSRIMAAIRSTDTKPERLARSALWELGLRGWRCHWRAPGGRIDIAFTRWKVAVFVDGCFWHGHPSKWQPGRWQGYWDDKIRRNMARDERQNNALAAAGWQVVRVWDFEVEHDAEGVARTIAGAIEAARREVGPSSRPARTAPSQT
jgi:DNA mismatch endonuclease (patch repair protein)